MTNIEIRGNIEGWTRKCYQVNCYIGTECVQSNECNTKAEALSIGREFKREQPRSGKSFAIIEVRY